VTKEFEGSVSEYGGLFYSYGNPKHGLDVVMGSLFIIAMIACLVFSLSTLALLIFHTYLAAQNLSSWEYLSWMRVTYMKVWPKKLGSPFSRGTAFQNLKQFFCYPFASKKHIYPWRMPTKLPKL